MLKSIQAVLGRYAVVGIPCLIKAVQLLRRADPLFRDRIQFTLGLFCGHMKSARFVESLAWQMQVPVRDIVRVEFRYKAPERPANWYNAGRTLRDGRLVQQDWWHLADGDWGAGFFMNAACNVCDDMIAETAEISFGDAWVELYASDGRGTNVVVVRSLAIAHLVARAIREGRLHLAAVDSALVEETQAAGFRQRREGLAYRLAWERRGVQPRKRVAPDASKPTPRRKLLYRMCYGISTCSHRVFWCARLLHTPHVYLRWARMAAAVIRDSRIIEGRSAPSSNVSVCIEER